MGSNKHLIDVLYELHTKYMYIKIAHNAFITFNTHRYTYVVSNISMTQNNLLIVSMV